ncbi:MAG: alpha/beta fold hydrolase [Chloroflexi bacterium]|nr:alpha/beta fold hydrolase [Chloroflexota bacterium]
MPYAETSTGRLYFESYDFGGAWQHRTPILLHHGVGFTADFWDGWMPALLARHPVVRFDMRGYGRSAVPESGYPWSFESFTDDIRAVLAAAGYDRCHYVGESIGGTIGLYVGSHAPELVTSLVCASTAYRGDYIQSLDDWQPAFETGAAPPGHVS